MENQKNNKGVIILLSVIIVILSVLCILFATGTISLNNNTNEVDNSGLENNGNKQEEDNVLDSLVGVWGYNDYVIEIKKQENEYVYSQGQYATDGGIGGIIKNIKEVSKNKYELEVFAEGCTGNNCLEEKEDETNYVLIEIDDSKNVIINNNNEYELITKDSTEYDKINNFFNN